MPLVNSDQAALWDGGATSLYRDGIGRGYVRDAMRDYYGNDVAELIAALESKGLTKADRVVLLGAGFGWAHEQFLAAGYGPTADGTANGKLLSVDTSAWIQSNKNGNATVTILNADVNAATGRRTIRQQFGSNNAEVQWIVTEDILPVLSDSECGILATNLRGLAATAVAHWITVGTRVWNDPGTWAGDARLNWKTLADWKALMQPDWVIKRGTRTVL